MYPQDATVAVAIIGDDKLHQVQKPDNLATGNSMSMSLDKAGQAGVSQQGSSGKSWQGQAIHSN